MDKRLFWVYALSSVIYFTQGIEGLPSQSLFYYLKETLGLSPEKIMFLGSITTSAWLVKPPIGYIIDNFLNKKNWIIIAVVLDIISVLFLGLINLPLFILIGMLVINSANTAFRDVAVDGIMCIEGKTHNVTGKIQSIQWISITVASLINGVLGGYIAERWGYQTAFLCLIPVYLIIIVPTYFFKETALLNRQGSRRTLLSDLKRLLSNKRFLLVGAFIFLYKYSPSFGTPLFFIQRDNFKWSKMWIGTLGTISTVFAIIGSLLYYKFSQKIKIKKWLFVSVFLSALVTLTYLYYTPLTAVIYDLLYSLIGMFIFLMVMDFMARNTLAGLEATSFAFLCSISNLALVASNLSGAILLPLLGLKWLIVLSSLTSFLCLIFINKIE
ncbi:MAG: MFS transporter [Candidatus Omnitrophica bacterium]|nr:MFS transporter [Candidatus Omnitrophota bacterium]